MSIQIPVTQREALREELLSGSEPSQASEPTNSKCEFLHPNYTIPVAGTLFSAVAAAAVLAGFAFSLQDTYQQGTPTDSRPDKALDVAKYSAIGAGASLAAAVVYTAGKAFYTCAQNGSRFGSRACEVFTDSVKKFKKPEGIIANTFVGILAIPYGGLRVLGRLSADGASC